MTAPVDIVKSIVQLVFERTKVCRDKRDAYNDGLSEVFRLQGERVVYPKQQVTCFKYRNKTYFNPKYPKVFDNQIEINLRHLHPTLMSNMDNLHKEIDDWDQNKRRLKAYLMRSLNVYFEIINEDHSLQVTLQQQGQDEAVTLFLAYALPPCITDIATDLWYPSHIPNMSMLDYTAFKTAVITKTNEFIDKEEAAVKQFKLFAFKTSVLGI